MLTIFLGVLFACLFTYLPVAFCLLVAGLVLMQMTTGSIIPAQVAQHMVRGVDSFPLMAIPFFCLAGELMNVGGISVRIVRFAKAFLGHVKGGLGYVTTVASMLFAGISGSAIADTTAIGSILLPIMEEEGYEKDEATALIIASGTIGPVIPPSMPMIIYGVIASVSVAKLFMGGIIPGILVGVGLMIVWTIRTRRRADIYRKGKKATWKERIQATKSAIWAIILPFVILGGVLSGVFTATEAGVVAVVYAVLVGFFGYKELKLKHIIPILQETAKSTASVMFVVGAATLAAYYITTAQIPAQLTHSLLSISTNPYVIMLLINILLLLVGCVMDLTPALLILAPILIPIVTSLGLSPIYFGVVMVCNLCIGIITPPVGTVLYVGCGLSKLSIAEVVKPSLPYIAVMVIVLFIITYCPGLIMYIPNLLG
ncbi:TRAP transporter large permease [Cellulosilyticum sp. I15G10I2]|uniref:TRAP transporter large permease n=1 Tax=Cellulosilyticum sp. I15G10I2 TaxID=1892843 RepID=UPI000A535E45|nr:TRAP transporter large permease [Cellulosilyticum sp. I15G10I2]